MSNNDHYHSSSRSVYLVQYHIIWCPKFRYPVLTNGVDGYLKALIFNICGHYGWTVKALEVMPEYVHVLVDASHTASSAYIASTLKSITAKYLFTNYPHLRQFYGRGKVMWSKGYFISSIGCISEETVRKYIEGQKTHG